MRESLMFLLMLMCFKYVHPHSDPHFLYARPPWEQLTYDQRGLAALCNPALLHQNIRFQWVCGVHNQQGVRHLNTLWLGGARRTDGRITLGIALRHSALPENEYLRTAGALGASIETGSKTSVGVSLRMIRLRLPSNLGSTFAAGSVAGFSARIGKKTTAGIAAGYHQYTGQKTGFSTISCEIRYDLTPNVNLGFTADMTSGQKPILSAYMVNVLPSGIRIGIGTGIGPELLQAGIILPFGNAGAGSTFAFNPLAGSSSSLLLTGKKERP
jgi:hypothetical protein